MRLTPGTIGAGSRRSDNATDTFRIDREELAANGRFTLADAYITKRPARELEYDFGDLGAGVVDSVSLRCWRVIVDFPTEGDSARKCRRF